MERHRTMARINQLLKEAREARGLTVAELSYLIHLDRSYISSIESGARGAGVATRRKYVEAGLITAEQALGVDSDREAS